MYVVSKGTNKLTACIIELPIPAGFEAIAYRAPVLDDYYLSDSGSVIKVTRGDMAKGVTMSKRIILKAVPATAEQVLAEMSPGTVFKLKSTKRAYIMRKRPDQTPFFVCPESGEEIPGPTGIVESDIIVVWHPYQAGSN